MGAALKRTPLFAVHRRAGAKMVEFGGWEMPVQYRGVIEEHLTVRGHAGLFDVSHMGEIEVRGAGALDFCQRLTANDVARLNLFQAQYNFLLNEQGGIVDDVIIYRVKPEAYFICVNAANIDKDFAWLTDHAGVGVDVEDQSGLYAQLALQGPAAEPILQSLTAQTLAAIKPFQFIFADVAAIRCMVARTGYTGEPGFELFCHADGAERLWYELMEAGSARGIAAVGLGARDTLRLEKAYPLYGHELSDTTTPLEAGFEWVLKWSKLSFLGRERLLQQKQQGVDRKLVGLEALEPGIPRGGYAVVKDGAKIGTITSGTKSPSLRKAIALAYVASADASIDNRLDVEIRGRMIPAKIVSLPFYRR